MFSELIYVWKVKRRYRELQSIRKSSSFNHAHLSLPKIKSHLDRSLLTHSSLANSQPDSLKSRLPAQGPKHVTTLHRKSAIFENHHTLTTCKAKQPVNPTTHTLSPSIPHNSIWTPPSNPSSSSKSPVSHPTYPSSIADTQ